MLENGSRIWKSMRGLGSQNKPMAERRKWANDRMQSKPGRPIFSTNFRLAKHNGCIYTWLIWFRSLLYLFLNEFQILWFRHSPLPRSIVFVRKNRTILAAVKFKSTFSYRILLYCLVVYQNVITLYGIYACTHQQRLVYFLVRLELCNELVNICHVLVQTFTNKICEIPYRFITYPFQF